MPRVKEANRIVPLRGFHFLCFVLFCFWVVGLIWFWWCCDLWLVVVVDCGAFSGGGGFWWWLLVGFDGGCIGYRWMREKERDNGERMRFWGFECNKQLKLELYCLVWFLISCLWCIGKNNGQNMLKVSNLHSKINKINSTRKKPKLINQWKEMDFVQYQQLCGSTSFPIMFWIFVSFAPANEL